MSGMIALLIGGEVDLGRHPGLNIADVLDRDLGLDDERWSSSGTMSRIFSPGADHAADREDVEADDRPE